MAFTVSIRYCIVILLCISVPCLSVSPVSGPAAAPGLSPKMRDGRFRGHAGRPGEQSLHLCLHRSRPACEQEDIIISAMAAGNLYLFGPNPVVAWGPAYL